MSDLNILPADQNTIRAAGFESSSTAGRVMAGQIDEVTGRILVDNAGGGGAATEIVVANEATDTTCFPVFVTAATGDLEPKSNAGLTFNSNTARLNATILASSSLTASEIVITDASKNLVSASVATYPSLTELTYLKGVTSAIQTQLGTKASTALSNLASVAINASLVPNADGTLTLGTVSNGWSVLNMSLGSLLNFNNGNAVVTHSSGILTVSTGDLRVTTAGTNSASVVTVGGTQTLTSKTLTSPVLTTPSAFTTGGTITLAENTSIALDPAGSADGKYTGITIAGTAGATLAFGDLVYLSSADSRWELADADAASTADRMLGMCVLAAASDGDPTVLLLMGQIRADAAFPALTIGSAVYVGETAGDIQVAIPTGADNVIRRVGYALTADEIYFNPSMDSQTTVA